MHSYIRPGKHNNNNKLVYSQNNPSNLFLTAIDYVGRLCTQCSSLKTSNLQSFSSSLTNLVTSMLVPRRLFLFNRVSKIFRTLSVMNVWHIYTDKYNINTYPRRECAAISFLSTSPLRARFACQLAVVQRDCVVY